MHLLQVKKLSRYIQHRYVYFLVPLFCVSVILYLICYAMFYFQYSTPMLVN